MGSSQQPGKSSPVSVPHFPGCLPSRSNAQKADQMADKNHLFSLSLPCIMAFPNLLEPKQFQGKGDPKYGGTFVFDRSHPDIDAMKKLIAQVGREKFPGVDLKTLAIPLKTGEKEIEAAKAVAAKKGKEYTGSIDWMAGKLVIKARSKFRPRMSYVEGKRIVDLEDETAIKAAAGKFFFGAEVLTQFNFFAYEGDARNPNGVGVYLNTLLATGGGTRMGGSGGQRASEVFSGYIGKHSAEDPTAGDDEIPF